MNNLSSKRSAAARRLTDRLILHSHAQKPAGFYIACEPYLTLPTDATTEQVGHAVQSVLAGFRTDIPQPSDWKHVTADFIRNIGVKSHKKLQESSIFCGIEEQNGKIEFVPSHNGGTSGDTKGFQAISGAKISLAANSATDEIGTALLKGFSLCTTIYEPS
jgi:hypothetical protein